VHSSGPPCTWICAHSITYGTNAFTFSHYIILHHFVYSFPIFHTSVPSFLLGRQSPFPCGVQQATGYTMRISIYMRGKKSVKSKRKLYSINYYVVYRSDILCSPQQLFCHERSNRN
ncbi:hypothetical protein L9F63_028034, partial [Diploptera punctata]